MAAPLNVPSFIQALRELPNNPAKAEPYLSNCIKEATPAIWAMLNELYNIMTMPYVPPSGSRNRISDSAGSSKSITSQSFIPTSLTYFQPYLKVQAMDFLHRAVQTSSYVLLYLTEIYLLPIVAEVACFNINNQGFKKTSQYFFSKGYPPTANLDEWSHQYVCFAMSCIFICSSIKPHQTFEKIQLTKSSAFKVEAIRLNNKGIPSEGNIINCDTGRLQTLKRRFQSNLSRFEEDCSQYIEFFMGKINLQINGTNDLKQTVNPRKLIEAGDVYLTSDCLGMCCEILEKQDNLDRKNNAFTLIADMIRWGDIQALMTLHYSDSIEKVGDRFIEANPCTADNIYPLVSAPALTRRNFAINFLTHIQLWSIMFPKGGLGDANDANASTDAEPSPTSKLMAKLIQKGWQFPTVNEQALQSLQVALQTGLQSNLERNQHLLKQLNRSNSQSRYLGASRWVSSRSGPTVLHGALQKLEKTIVEMRRQIEDLPEVRQAQIDRAVKGLTELARQYELNIQEIEQLEVDNEQVQGLLYRGEDYLDKISSIEEIHQSYKKKTIKYDGWVAAVQGLLSSLLKRDNSRILKASISSIGNLNKNFKKSAFGLNGVLLDAKEGQKNSKIVFNGQSAIRMNNNEADNDLGSRSQGFDDPFRDSQSKISNDQKILKSVSRIKKPKDQVPVDDSQFLVEKLQRRKQLKAKQLATQKQVQNHVEQSTSQLNSRQVADLPNSRVTGGTGGSSNDRFTLQKDTAIFIDPNNPKNSSQTSKERVISVGISDINTNPRHSAPRSEELGRESYKNPQLKGFKQSISQDPQLRSVKQQYGLRNKSDVQVDKRPQNISNEKIKSFGGSSINPQSQISDVNLKPAIPVLYNVPISLSYVPNGQDKVSDRIDSGKGNNSEYKQLAVVGESRRSNKQADAAKNINIPKGVTEGAYSPMTTNSKGTRQMSESQGQLKLKIQSIKPQDRKFKKTMNNNQNLMYNNLQAVNGHTTNSYIELPHQATQSVHKGQTVDKGQLVHKGQSVHKTQLVHKAQSVQQSVGNLGSNTQPLGKSRKFEKSEQSKPRSSKRIEKTIKQNVQLQTNNEYNTHHQKDNIKRAETARLTPTSNESNSPGRPGTDQRLTKTETLQKVREQIVTHEVHQNQLESNTKANVVNMAKVRSSGKTINKQQFQSVTNNQILHNSKSMNKQMDKPTGYNTVQPNGKSSNIPILRSIKSAETLYGINRRLPNYVPNIKSPCFRNEQYIAGEVKGGVILGRTERITSEGGDGNYQKIRSKRQLLKLPIGRLVGIMPYLPYISEFISNRKALLRDKNLVFRGQVQSVEGCYLLEVGYIVNRPVQSKKTPLKIVLYITVSGDDGSRVDVRQRAGNGIVVVGPQQGKKTFDERSRQGRRIFHHHQSDKKTVMNQQKNIELQFQLMQSKNVQQHLVSMSHAVSTKPPFSLPLIDVLAENEIQHSFRAPFWLINMATFQPYEGLQWWNSMEPIRQSKAQPYTSQPMPQTILRSQQFPICPSLLPSPSILSILSYFPGLCAPVSPSQSSSTTVFVPQLLGRFSFHQEPNYRHYIRIVIQKDRYMFVQVGVVGANKELIQWMLREIEGLFMIDMDK